MKEYTKLKSVNKLFLSELVTLYYINCFSSLVLAEVMVIVK